MKKPTRDSRFELLRTILMLFIIILHFTGEIGSQRLPDFLADFPKAFTINYVQSLTNVGVNCFIFITGWFSIKLSVMRFVDLWFRVAFIAALMYGIHLALSTDSFNLRDFLLNTFTLESYWFIATYMSLMLLAPVLNHFASQTSLKEQETYLAIIGLITMVVGYRHPDVHMGKSLISFSFLYLLARHLRRAIDEHDTETWAYRLYKRFSGLQLLGIYILLAIPTALGYAVILGHAYYCSSINMVVMSLCLFLLFVKMKPFYSRFVNWMGASALTAYISHEHLCARPIRHTYITELFNSLPFGYFWLALLGTALAVLLGSILLDQPRKWLWELITKPFSSKAR